MMTPLVADRRLPTPVVEKLLAATLSQSAAIAHRLEATRKVLDAVELEVLNRAHVKRYLDARIEADGIHFTARTILEWVLGIGLPRKKLGWYFTEVDPSIAYAEERELCPGA